MSENPHDAVGQQVGNYRLVRCLGRGGFANVYLGEHIYLKTQGAIKMLHVHLSEKSLRDFFNEARTVARLKHPNIIRLLDYGVEEGNPFLVVTYAPNGSLRQCFPPRTPLPPEQVVSIVKQVASALDYAHRQRLIHRDVKPANMLLGPHNEVLLSDFGLARVARSTSLQVTGEVGGTVSYMAPEQLQGKARFASDQYALGVVAYEWLCGERPFLGSLTEVASQHMIITPPSLREKVPRLPVAVERVVFKALAKKPTQRYDSVRDFADALQQAYLDSKLTATHVVAVQLASPPLETSQIPTEPLRIKSATQRLRPLKGVWRVALVFVTLVMLILAGMGLWYGSAHLQALRPHATPSSGKSDLTPIVKNNVPTVVNTTSPAVIKTPGGTLRSISGPDCLKGSPSNIAFFAQSYSFPFPTETVTLTNCGGSATTWSYSEQTNQGTWLNVTAASQSIALNESEQVQVSIPAKPNVRPGTYRETITFIKGSAVWTVSVSYTVH